MKQLIWKELWENRYLPPLCAVMVFLSIGLGRLDIAHSASHPDYAATINDLCWFTLALTPVLAAFLAASNAVAPEVGRGSLAFLFSLPCPRQRIWLVKVGSGLAVVAASAALTTLAYVAAVAIFLPSSGPGSSGHTYARGLWIEDGALYTLILAYAFAFGLLVSTLVDRATTVMVVSVAIGPFALYLLCMLESLVLPDDGLYGAIAAAALACLAGSYTAFTRADAERSQRRTWTGIGTAAATLVGLGGLIVAGHGYLAWVTH